MPSTPARWRWWRTARSTSSATSGPRRSRARRAEAQRRGGVRPGLLKSRVGSFLAAILRDARLWRALRMRSCFLAKSETLMVRSAALRRVSRTMLRIAWRTMKAAHLHSPQSKRAANCSAALVKSLQEETYFRLLIAVRSKDSLAIPAEPHQFEPAPPGLIAVTLVVPVALKALVKALQSPLFRSVPE